MTKEEIQIELDNSLARIDESFSDIKDEITKPLDDLVAFVEEKPLVAVGSAALLGLVLASMLGGGSKNRRQDHSNMIDRHSMETLIQNGISKRESGMNLSDAVHSAIRETPVNTYRYASPKKRSSFGLLSILGSKAGRSLTQTLLQNGIGILNGLVKDRINKE